MDRREIYQGIQKVLHKTLDQGYENITPNATLVGDLGAESIDFLSITFETEREFNIRIPRGELFPEGSSTDMYEERGGEVYFTKKGLDEIRKEHTHLEFDNSEEEMSLRNLADLYTVESLVKYVDNKLNPSK